MASDGSRIDQDEGSPGYAIARPGTVLAASGRSCLATPELERNSVWPNEHAQRRRNLGAALG